MQTKLQETNNSPISDIRKVIASLVSAYQSGDAAGIASFFTETAVLIPPNEPPVVGVEEIRSRFECFFDGFDYRIEFEPRQTELVGGMGFERGIYSASAVLKGESQPRGGRGEYMLLLEHQLDDAWLISAFGTAAPGEDTPLDGERYHRWMGAMTGHVDVPRNAPSEILEKLVKGKSDKAA